MGTQALVNIKNVHGYVDENGTVYLNVEDVARGLGFTQVKKGVEYVRWETVNSYLQSFGFSQHSGKDDFIPENMFYRLAMKASNAAAQTFQAKVADEILPAIRKTGFYSTKPLSLAQQIAMQAQLNLQFEERFEKVEGTLSQQDERLDKITDTVKYLQDRNNAVALNSRLTDIKQQDQLDRHDNSIKELQEVIGDKGPAEEIKTLISDIVTFTANTDKPYSYKDAYDLFYDTLKQHTGIRISTRISNHKKRMEAKGWTKTKVNKISGLDAITADPMTWQRVREAIDILRGYLKEAQE